MAAAADEEPPETLMEPLMDFSNIGRTVDGSGFVYRSLSCTNRRIGVIKAIESYLHLQSVDFSNNLLNHKELAPLQKLEHVVKLNLSNNRIDSLKQLVPAEGEVFPHLVELDLSGNQLTALPPLPFKALQAASFARNEIASCQEFGGHEKLTALDLSENKLPDLAGLAALPALTSLQASSNELMSITGLAEVPALQVLRLARNPMEALEGPWQELSASPVETLDLSGCQLPSAPALEVLRSLPLLRNLEVQGNPLMEAAAAASARVEVLVCHWRVSTLNGEPVTADELEQARELNVKRLEEAALRKAEEEAAAAAAAGEEG